MIDKIRRGKSLLTDSSSMSKYKESSRLQITAGFEISVKSR